MASRNVRSALYDLTWLGVAMVCLAGPARGQVPQPTVPDVNQRSGLISRFIPIQPWLPKDADRDTFYDTRWADRPEVRWPNHIKHGGIYGLRWGGDCTECNYPNFRGSPGRSTLDPGCRYHHPAARWYENFIHPWRPVCHYYEGGCFVPVYDLDPLVTGPGPFPWPFLLKGHNGG